MARARNRRLAIWLSVAAAIVATYATPIALLGRATRHARLCLAGFTTPRSHAPPRCDGLASGFDPPARVPWTARPALLRREELGARIAIAAHLDAAVGTPDPEALAARAPSLDEWGSTIRAGSGRLVLEELGPAVAAPSRGLGAMSVGDRGALIAGYRDWDRWDIRKAALDAALIEGDLETATEIAAHYAAGSFASEDLKTMAGAVLCLSERPQEGLPLLLEVAEKRADARHEAMARHFGELSVVAMACAARAGAPLPPLPREYGAGVADAIETRAITRVRLSAQGAREPLETSLDLASVLLESEPRPRGLGLWPETPGARASLVAAMLAADPDLDANRTLALLRRRDDREASAHAEPALTATRAWRRPGALLTPVVSAPVLRRAAERLDEMAEGRARLRLHAAAADLWFRLATLEATLGHPEPAAEATSRAVDRAAADPRVAVLGRAVAYRLAGRPADALAAMGEPVSPTTEGWEAAPSLSAALLLEQASALAAVGRTSEAGAALESITPALLDRMDPWLHAESRWLALALPGRSPDPAGETSPPPSGPPPWIGYADRAGRWLDADRTTLPATLAWWERGLVAPPDTQRAYRYALLERRGDAPPALVPYLFVASRLLAGDEAPAAERGAAIETWLDALTAHELRAPTLRAYAWARAEAALWRGDREASRRWSERLGRLRALAADPERAEIATYLGI